MAKSKRKHPESGPSVKKTYYQDRGKVHLVRYIDDKESLPAERVWCGVKMENCNHYTAKQEECTCQKCFMVLTGTWRTPRREGC